MSVGHSATIETLAEKEEQEPGAGSAITLVSAYLG